MNDFKEQDKNESEIMPWKVLAAIPGTNGALNEIALKLKITRSALRKFLLHYPEIQEEIDDEREASVERIMRQQYDEAMDGNMQARESYIKMISGYFTKRDDKKNIQEDLVQVKIVLPETPKETHLALDPETNELIELDNDLKPLK